jgi:hypothetical protein
MNVSDEIRKTLSDPKPFYALAGAGDLAAEKLKDAPERLRDTPTLLAEASATLTTLANKIAAEAPERLAKVTSGVQDATGRGRPDAQALRGLAQSVAIQQVGRLLEAAGKAVETYDELAERGRVVISRYTGVGGEGADGQGSSEGPVTVLVEQVTDEDAFDDFAAEAETVEVFDAEPPEEEAEPEQVEPGAGSAAEAAQVFEEAAEAQEQAEAAAAQTPKPAAKKAAPRKRTTGPKAPRKPKD